MAAELNSGEAIGLDLTQGMLVLADRKRSQLKSNNTSFERGDIMHLPHADASFEVVTGGYALRNVPDIAGALEEIYVQPASSTNQVAPQSGLNFGWTDQASGKLGWVESGDQC